MGKEHRNQADYNHGHYFREDYFPDQFTPPAVIREDETFTGNYSVVPDRDTSRVDLSQEFPRKESTGLLFQPLVDVGLFSRRLREYLQDNNLEKPASSQARTNISKLAVQIPAVYAQLNLYDGDYHLRKEHTQSQKEWAFRGTAFHTFHALSDAAIHQAMYPSMSVSELGLPPGQQLPYMAVMNKVVPAFSPTPQGILGLQIDAWREYTRVCHENPRFLSEDLKFVRHDDVFHQWVNNFALHQCHEIERGLWLERGETSRSKTVREKPLTLVMSRGLNLAVNAKLDKLFRDHLGNTLVKDVKTGSLPMVEADRHVIQEIWLRQASLMMLMGTLASLEETSLSSAEKSPYHQHELPHLQKVETGITPSQRERIFLGGLLSQGKPHARLLQKLEKTTMLYQALNKNDHSITTYQIQLSQIQWLEFFSWLKEFDKALRIFSIQKKVKATKTSGTLAGSILDESVSDIFQKRLF